MIFDKLSMFADGLTVATTASATTYGKTIDLRKNGQIGIDGMLRVWAGVQGTANTVDATHSGITTKLQTSADGLTWSDVLSETQNGNKLMGVFLPCKGLKRFVRLAFTVGTYAMSAAVNVQAGLVDNFDNEDLPTVQAYPVNPSAGTNTGLEDLTTLGDKLAEDLVMAEATKSVTKGSSGTVDVSAGIPTAATAPTGYTVTLAEDKVTIALTSAAASGNVVLVGGTGNTVTIAVTAA